MMEEMRKTYIMLLRECLDGKWKNPVYPENMYSWGDCAVCVAHRLYPYLPCPIGLAIDGTGCSGCYGTPISRGMDTEDLSEADWNEMVRDERALLQAIIDHLEAGHELSTFKELTTYDWGKDA